MLSGSGPPHSLRSDRLPFVPALVAIAALAMSQGAIGQTVLLSIDGTSSGDLLGYSVARVGDYDGDGVGDLFVGAPNAGGTGRAEIRSTSTGALLMAFLGTGGADHFGYSLADAGDVNADGVPDLIVGAPQNTCCPAPSNGYARVFSGAGGGTLHTFTGTGSGYTADRMGWSVSSAGDVDGDGHSDLMAGGINAEPAGSPCCDAGQVRIFSGATGSVLRTWNGLYEGGRFGSAVCPLGDVNGDGVPDQMASGMHGMQCPGFVGGPGHARVFSGATGAELFSVVGVNPVDRFGFSLASVGDLDGDGVVEFAVGSPRFDPPGIVDAGGVVVFSGAGGSPLYTLAGSGTWDWFGASITRLPDLDNDGVPDLAVGAPQATPFVSTQPDSGCSGIGSSGAGYLRLFSGAGGEPLVTIQGTSSGDAFGYGVAGLGDLDGDGKPELAVGAPWADAAGLDNSGRVTVLSLAGLIPVPFGSGCPGA
ncbi:MAG: integrin alpha, partial [Planctomycetes bacterium]|nr:integrin alpha [Planctomycetota bacterium]